MVHEGPEVTIGPGWLTGQAIATPSQEVQGEVWLRQKEQKYRRHSSPGTAP